MTKNELEELIELQKDSEFLKESYNNLKKRYVNQYVAIKDRDVIVHHKNIETVLKKLKEKRLNPANILIEFLHPKDMVLIL